MKFAKESWPFVMPWSLLGILLFALGRPGWGVTALVASVAVLQFFRDPARCYRGDASAVLAPADGLVTGVDQVEDAEVGPGRRHRIVTFLSVFDVHVQRAPAAGEVITSRHAAGRKVAAFRLDAGEVNEQHLTVIRCSNGDLVGVRQIAGLLARRVVCHLQVGDRVQRGQGMGLIKFGSRVDLILPPHYRLMVARKDRVRTGATPVALPGAAGASVPGGPASAATSTPSAPAPQTPPSDGHPLEEERR